METNLPKSIEELKEQAKRQWLAIAGSNYLQSELLAYTMGYLEAEYRKLAKQTEDAIVRKNYFNNN